MLKQILLKWEKSLSLLNGILAKKVPQHVLALARRVGAKVESREGKDVFRRNVSHFHPRGNERLPCVPRVLKWSFAIATPTGSRC